MRKVGMMMTVLMGITMSFVLSLVGNLMGGHFTLISWLVSFAISLVISLAIGFVVPMKKVGDAVCKKCKVVPESPKGNLISALISDLIYTPLITIVMVNVMIGSAVKHLQAAGVPASELPSVGRALPGSLIVCFVVGYVVIAVIQPVYIKMLIKKMNIEKK